MTGPGPEDDRKARERAERIERLEVRAAALGIEMHAAATSGDADRIAVLLEHGAKIGFRLPDGQAPLHAAAQGGRAGFVEALLEAGAAPDVRDENARTPLHLAAVRGDARMIEALVEAGANPAAKDGRGRTPSDLLPVNVPDRVREACRPTADGTARAAGAGRDPPAPDIGQAGEDPRNRNHERRDVMRFDHQGRPDAGLRTGDRVRQPDGSWKRVVSVDGHGAWLEGNLVTAPRVPADWYRENVRNEREIEAAGAGHDPPAPESPQNGGNSRNPIHERRTPMEYIRHGTLDAGFRTGDHVRQPDGSWKRVIAVDGHGAWLSRNPVAAPRASADVRTEINDGAETGGGKDIRLGVELKEDQVRSGQRRRQLLQLACMATERIAPDRREGWGDLQTRISDLLDAVDRAGDVPEEAVEAQARRTARKRAESDVWVKAAREAGGGLLHEARARYEGSADFYRQDQMRRNAEALTKGLEGLTEADLRPTNLERLVATAVVATAGTRDAEVAHALETGLRLGRLPSVPEITAERTQLVNELSRPMERPDSLERMELTGRVYRAFPEDDIRDICQGKGRIVDATKDPEAQARLVGNVRALHSEPVSLPVPWRELHAGIAVSTGAAAKRQQPERSAVAARNVISASM